MAALHAHSGATAGCAPRQDTRGSASPDGLGGLPAPGLEGRRPKHRATVAPRLGADTTETERPARRRLAHHQLPEFPAFVYNSFTSAARVSRAGHHACACC